MPRKKHAKKSILAIGSHPDDIEFGCAGTVSHFVKKGYDAYMMILSNGSEGGDPSTREEEQSKSARQLGVKHIFWGSFTDTRLPFYDNVISEIEKTIRAITPSFVFVHYGKDTHQDHRHVSTSTVAATRNVSNVLFYEGPTTFDFKANVFVDIGKELKTKLKCLECHYSQVMRTNISHQSIVEIAQATAVFRGTECRVQHAEAFSSLRLFL